MKITGTLEGITAKPGKSKKPPFKPYTLYDIVVNGQKYSIGFNPVSFATGDLITFEAVQNEGGYWNADPASITSSGPAPAAATGSSPTASGSVSGNDPRQRSIETQACIKAAAPIVAAMIQSGSDVPSPSAAVAELVRDFLRILHPTPKPKPKPVVAEMVEDDPFGDPLPY